MRAGGEGEGKKGEKDLPHGQGAGNPRQGGLEQDEELFQFQLLRFRHLGVI